MGAIHARHIATAAGASLHAVCDHDPAARARAEAAHGVRVTSRLDDLLGCDLDAVVIASSTQEHADQITRCAEAGLAIFTEKPVGLSVPEADAALMAVEAAGVPFQIGYQRRWDSDYLRMKELIEEGTIGTPVLFRAQGRDPDASSPHNWGLDKNGGTFVNCAIHDYDATRFMFGREVVAVTATGDALVHKQLQDFGDIDTCSTVLELEGGGMAITEWSRFATYGYDVCAEMIGTDGVIRIGPESSGGLSVRGRAERPLTVFERFSSAYRASIEGFVSALRDGLAPSPGVVDAQAALTVAILARESHKAGSRVVTPTSQTLGWSRAGG